MSRQISALALALALGLRGAAEECSVDSRPFDDELSLLQLWSAQGAFDLDALNAQLAPAPKKNAPPPSSSPPPTKPPAASSPPPTSDTGVLIPDSQLICYEGPATLLSTALDNLRITPAALLWNASNPGVIVGTTCAARGYRTAHDDPDDCWAPAVKWVRSGDQGVADANAWGQAQPASWAQWTAAHGVNISYAFDILSCICAPDSSNYQGISVDHPADFCDNLAAEHGITITHVSGSV